jgi:hypothetical protein
VVAIMAGAGPIRGVVANAASSAGASVASAAVSDKGTTTELIVGPNSFP